MSKILISGATGGLGGAVASFLKDELGAEEIAVLVRNAESEKAKALTGEGFEVRVGDYDDKPSLLKAFAGIDILYFVSGSDLAARVPQHRQVVEAAKEAGIGHIVYTSASLNQLSEDAPLYGPMSAHTQTEQWIKDSGLTYTLLRHNLYTEVIPMFLGSKEQLLGSKTVFLPTGTGETAFVSKEELAEAGAYVLVHASEYRNQVLELNGSHKVTFAEIASYLSNITEENIGYVSPDISTFEETLTKYGVPAEYIGMMAAFGQGISDGVFDAPASDLEDLLGRKSLPVKDFLAEVYN